jgi:hypothetical protein
VRICTELTKPFACLLGGLLLWWLSGTRLPAAQRINQEGRILGPPPVVSTPILFNTTNADAVVAAMQIFPVTNPWNEDISQRPLLANSSAMIAQIMTNLSANHRTLAVEYEMNYVLLPDNQPLVPVDFFNYPDESDLNGGVSPWGLYPVPANLPIETWPWETGTQTLYQRQTNNDGSDRHAIMVEPGAGFLWETWETALAGTNWQASNGAQFNLATNGLRLAGWTSGDAAGLPIFPALVRYDEAERGMVEHACRLVVAKTLYNNYLYPATHYASAPANTSTNLPSMGQRLRLQAAFAIPAAWTPEEKAVALGLKKYGALVADNGSVFSISVTPDNRWPANCFSDFSSLSITNFEVIQTTGINGGPRSPGAPAAGAGSSQTVRFGQTAQLAGVVTWSNVPPVIRWTNYSGPGAVTFGNAAQTNTTAAFSAPGDYTLELSAADGVHAVAYDAVVITVTNAINAAITRSGTNVTVSWAGGTAPYLVQQTGLLAGGVWSNLATTSGSRLTLPITNAARFYRVQGQ